VIKIALMNSGSFTGSFLALFQWGKILYCALVFFAIKKLKKHPIVYIVVSAAAGILLKF